jgi:hypothetical protein
MLVLSEIQSNNGKTLKAWGPVSLESLGHSVQQWCNGRSENNRLPEQSNTPKIIRLALTQLGPRHSSGG